MPDPLWVTKGPTTSTVAASARPGGHCPNPISTCPLPLQEPCITLIRIKKQVALQLQGCALIGKKNRGSVTGSRAGCQAETFSRRGHPGWLQALQNRPLGRRERVEGGRVWEPFPDGAGRPQASPASAFGRVYWPFIGSPSLEWALQGKRRPSACGVSAVCSAPSPEPGVRGAEVRCLENSADPHH